jgi:hypothetical protein
LRWTFADDSYNYGIDAASFVSQRQSGRNQAGLMDQPARVWKTLGCLVMAMTGTAAFLGWLDPTPALPPDALPYDEIMRLARSAVTDEVKIRRERWHAVEIGADTVLSGGRLLSATAGARDRHFYVGHDGLPTRAGQWAKQESLAVSPHTIRIQVERLREDQPMSPAQWACVRVLVTTLTEAITPDGPSLPVRLGACWERVYGVEPGSVFEFVPQEVTSS